MEPVTHYLKILNDVASNGFKVSVVKALLSSNDVALRYYGYINAVDIPELGLVRTSFEWPQSLFIKAQLAKSKSYDVMPFEVDIENPRDNTDVIIKLYKSYEKFDFEEIINSKLDLYVITNDVEHLKSLVEDSREFGDQTELIKSLLRLCIVEPKYLKYSLYEILVANRYKPNSEIFSKVGLLAERFAPKSQAAFFYSLVKEYDRQNFSGVLDKVAAVKNPGNNSFLFEYEAKVREKVSDFKGAYLAIKKQNATNRDIDKAYIYNIAQKLNEMEPEADMPVLTSAKHVIFTGFPRSGTTLLELALSSHSRIETVEEKSDFTRTLRSLMYDNTQVDMVNDGSFQRLHLQKYFNLLDRRLRGREVIVDKTPILSVFGQYLKNFMQNTQFLFALRDPYDVVFSCVKQNFKQNFAMANLDSISDAIQLYDYTMNVWSHAFGSNNPCVKYVRYENLISGYDTELSGIFKFLGIEKEHSSSNIASLASDRTASTPSYEKLQHGILPYQTYRGRFDFVFSSDDRDKLNKWCKFWGYEVL